MPNSPSKNLQRVLEAASDVVLGKPHPIRMALACLVARGHLLIEDMPGVGKTTLAHALARLLGLQFARVQFTSDMLPADLLGTTIFERDSGRFRFHPGPVFAQVLLADEINRATPKAQSALLEAMEERQVTLDGETRALPQPFFVIATQNPAHQIGTFPLPESQLDRFMMRIELGYPARDAERALLAGMDRRQLIAQLAPVMDPTELEAAQAAAERIHAAPALFDYVLALIEHTRGAPEFEVGLSPRGGLALMAAARAWALLAGRDHVLPEDVQAVAPGVIPHRLLPAGELRGRSAPDLTAALIAAVPVP
ncbi:MAG: AAA family ATPase [Rhodocyclaceae bacterium]|nr:AAA family ATPase [Rhodocyclaceae bacterium]MBX3669203.1 AAA family ATPase [Rhodocyclaceae bacterium]